MDDASRVFWMRRTLDSQLNDDTLYVPSFLPPTPRHATGELFFEFYDAIRDWLHDHEAPGLAVVALDETGIQAKAYMRAHDTRVNSAIVGRHERAEIFLGDDAALSLRHLAVLVSPTTHRKPQRVRVIDLRTASGMMDERGMRIRACESEHPFFIRCGRYSVLFAPVSGRGGDEPRWPEEPEAMWAALRRRDGASLGVSHPATLDDGLLLQDEKPLGELVIETDEGRGTMPVGMRAARSGILLGRSDRCDGDSLLADPHISRVHALIVEMSSSLYAIDTASKNGLWGKQGDERAQLLESGTYFSLCGRARVEWRFFH